jgi:hypothetical protein
MVSELISSLPPMAAIMGDLFAFVNVFQGDCVTGHVLKKGGGRLAMAGKRMPIIEVKRWQNAVLAGWLRIKIKNEGGKNA